MLEAQVLHDQDSAHFIQIQGDLDMSQRQTQVTLYAASEDGTRKTDKAFATATVCYEDAQHWQSEWQMASHLVATRARSLWQTASGRRASDEDASQDSRSSSRVSRLSRGAVYQLFANVVDYARRYRGMQRVALAEESQEATADILLDDSRHGTWHTPPHWIDSTFQLAGFVMNAFGVQEGDGTAGSSRDFFYITPGWRSFRLAEPLAPGPDVSYRNYVHMFPVQGEPGTFAGDIYLLRGERVVGVCAGIRFKRVPRALMSVMFPRQAAAPGKGNGRGGGQYPGMPSTGVRYHGNSNAQNALGSVTDANSSPTHVMPATASLKQEDDDIQPVARTEPTQGPTPDNTRRAPALGGGEKARVDACLGLIAEETGLDLDDLSGDAAFAELGVDSLMSLALSDKMRVALGIDVKASIFIECATVQDLVNWLK